MENTEEKFNLFKFTLCPTVRGITLHIEILYNTYQEMAIWKSIVTYIYKEFYLPMAGK